jgi:hypothetical protein
MRMYFESDGAAGFRAKVCAFALGLAALIGAAPAEAALQWWQIPAPGAVSAVAVGPNDIPFVIVDGTVYYLSRNHGPCVGIYCPDKWISLPGIDATALFIDMAGQPYALKRTTGEVFVANTANPSRTAIWKPGGPWTLAYYWWGCVKSFAVSGFISSRPQAFLTSGGGLLSSWDQPIWATDCGSDDDTTLWVLPRTRAGGSPGWRQLVASEPAVSQKVAVFTRYAPAGPRQEVVFLDSVDRLGRIWVYDQDDDELVSRKNPTPRSGPTQKPAIGTAITDHFARFRRLDKNAGWVFQWDDATGKSARRSFTPSTRRAISSTPMRRGTSRGRRVGLSRV